MNKFKFLRLNQISIYFLILVLFLSGCFAYSPNQEDEKLFEQISFDEQNSAEQSGTKSFYFSPDELDKAQEQFPDLIIPDNIPERYELEKLEFLVMEEQDYMTEAIYYKERITSDEGTVLLFNIRDKKQDVDYSSMGFGGVTDAVEFENGLIVYHEDIFNGVLMITKLWNSGELIFISGVVTTEELEWMIDGISLDEEDE